MTVTELPVQERPISEQFRLVAKKYVEADSAARLLEEMKTTTLEQQKQDLIEAEGDMPDSHAERRVKSSPKWAEYIKSMVDARTDANLKKLQMEYLRMRFTEQQDANASARAEMRLVK
jgi:hypothetical protein